MDCNVYIKRLDVIDSTNRYARDEAVSLWREAGDKELVAVTARHQTAGRGQRGNVWNSLAGENLLLTLVVRPGQSLQVCRQFLLSQAVAVAIHSAMARYGIDARLKWPNDIYVGNRKLAGILVELDYSASCVEQAIIGIGLNVNQSDFPAMDRIPVSMKMLLGKEFPVDDVMCDVIECFSRYYAGICTGEADSIATEYKELLLGIGEERHFVDAQGPFMATVEGTEPDGHLLLRRSDGTLSRYAFKEVEQPMG